MRFLFSARSGWKYNSICDSGTDSYERDKITCFLCESVQFARPLPSFERNLMCPSSYVMKIGKYSFNKTLVKWVIFEKKNNYAFYIVCYPD